MRYGAGDNPRHRVLPEKTFHRTMVLGAVILLCCPVFAEADEEPVSSERFGLELDLGSRLVYSSAFEAFSRSPVMGAMQLGVSWQPAVHEQRVLLDLRAGLGGTQARGFRGFDASLGVTTLTASVSWRQGLVDAVWAGARFGAGAEHVRVAIDDDAGAPWRASTWTMVLEGTVSIELVSALRGGGAERDFGVRIESGYGWRPGGAELGAVTRADYSEEVPRIESVGVDLGNLDLSGWIVRGALAFYFQ